MTSPLRNSSIPADAQNWRAFADGLVALTRMQGAPHFPERAIEFLGRYVAVDLCTAFKIASNRRTGASHILTFGRLDESTTDRLAAAYTQEGFRKDPSIQTARPEAKATVRKAPFALYKPDYRAQFFDDVALVDKVSILQMASKCFYSVNFYRMTDSGPFSQAEHDDLARIGPILSPIILRHAELVRSPPDDEDNHQKIIGAVNDESTIFATLSKRERDVCSRLLLGMPEQAIAAELDISMSTVVTHRRRTYLKLGVHSKEELFHLALDYIE